MEKFRYDDHLDEEPIPADYFDLTGGTSTGGIIALLFGRLRMTVTESLEAYKSISENVFAHKKPTFSEGMFKASKLEDEMQRVLAAKLGDGHKHDAIMDAADKRPECKAYVYSPSSDSARSHTCRFVCAASAGDMGARGGPTPFRSYEVRENKSFNCKIWEAARATSAAPTFFKRIDIGYPGEEVSFLDASLGYNNPIKQVLDECKVIFPQGRRLGCI